MSCSPTVGAQCRRQASARQRRPMSLDRYRTAIVTGASRGIGAAIVRQLRIGGLEVWAIARSADDLAELAQETGCRPLALDITHRQAVLGALGGLDADILVNNASALV